jgi:hypothetical protein
MYLGELSSNSLLAVTKLPTAKKWSKITPFFSVVIYAYQSNYSIIWGVEYLHVNDNCVLAGGEI